MKKWTAMKSIIEACDQRKDLFLSLIDEEGTIVCANARMVKDLHLQNPRAGKTNFLSVPERLFFKTEITCGIISPLFSIST